MKYRDLLEQLDNEVVYTPATIAAYAEEINYINEADEGMHRLMKQRIRITLGRYSNNHKFPDEGDGMVIIRGQAPTPGWFGWRWKRALRNK